MNETMIRVRMSSADSHYAGGLVNGARILDLFGDVATELLIRLDGDEGLLASYENVKFLSPVFAGDYIEATGKIIKKGKTSRTVELKATKVITPAEDCESPSAAEVLAEPVLVVEATAICVVPAKRQRKKG